MPPKTHPCLRCKGNVGKEAAVQCGVCRLWVHKKCEKLSDEVFNFLSDNIQAGVLWQCSCCQSSTAELSAAVKSLRTELTAVTERVGKTEDTNKLQDSRLDKLEALTKNLEQRLDNNKEEVSASILEEMREREEKRGNILIHNVGESDSAAWEEQKRWDVCPSTMLWMQFSLTSNLKTRLSSAGGWAPKRRAGVGHCL